MADIEPYRQIQKTNIKEHNDIVAKINEIINIINNTNLDTIVPKISALETEVSTIKATDSLQWTDIEGLKDSQSAQDVTIGALNAQVKGVTESLVSDIAIIDGITTGNMKVRVEREKAPAIDSNDYNIQKPVSMELIQGSGPSTFKAQITLSDGTIIRSDDFMFTTEAIGTDVYISSFVFKNGNVAGTISADIGLSNGTTIEANNFVVPMDPSLITTVQDLSTRLSAVEGGTVAGLDELKAQVQTNTTNIGTLTTDIDDLDISKADQSNPSQTIKADTTDLRTVKLRDSTDAVGSYLQFNADANKPVRMEYYNGSEVVDSGYIATVDSDGKPKNFSAGGEKWETIDLSNIPTDWTADDIVKIRFKGVMYSVNYPSSWATTPPSAPVFEGGGTEENITLEYSLKGGAGKLITKVQTGNSYIILSSVLCYSYAQFNSGNMIVLELFILNGGGLKSANLFLNRNNIRDYVAEIKRLVK